jgi:hypothetical protein
MKPTNTNALAPVTRLHPHRERRYEVWEPFAFGKKIGEIEFCENLHDAAQAAALLLLDRAQARQASNDGLYVAHGARHEGMPSSEIKFLIKEVK